MKHLLLCSLLLFTISCSIFQKAQAPKRSDTAQKMTADLQTEVASFYSDMSKAVGDKSYSGNKAQYSNIGNDIRLLAVFDSARKHSSTLMIIVHDTENRFHVYEQEHSAAGNINNAHISAYREGMDALLDILVRTENHYK